MTSAPSTSDSGVQRPTAAAALQMTELVLKTGRFEQMRAWYVHMLGREPFFERVPNPDDPPRPAGMPERAVDVRLAFIKIHDNGHPYTQVLGLFGLESLDGADAAGPGLHHCQFGVSSLEQLFDQYDHMVSFGAASHRAANHGQATSIYFRDPDGNIVEFSTPNFDSPEQVEAFMHSPQFARNPSGVEHDPVEFAARFRAGESIDRLLSLEPSADPA